MRAAVLYQHFEDPRVEEVPDPECPKNGVVVEVSACGLCRSDHHVWRGAEPDIPLPHIMGHEFAGRIVEVGREAGDFTLGQRVTAPFILACGACTACHAGRATTCDHQNTIGFGLPGAFANYLAIAPAEANLVPLPDRVSDAEAAILGCRATTAWRAVHDRAQIRPNEWLVIVGAGGAGLAAVLIGKAADARVIAVDPNPKARAMAMMLGADHVLEAGKDTLEAIHTLTQGGADVAIEAVGRTQSFDLALRSLRKLGRYVQIGMPTGAHETVPLPLLELIYGRELVLMGMRGLPAPDFAGLLAQMDQGRLEFTPLIRETIALQDLGCALRDMDTPTWQGGISVVTEF